MVEIVGDIVQPSTLIIPSQTDIPAGSELSGQLMLSGQSVHVWASSWIQLSGVNTGD